MPLRLIKKLFTSSSGDDVPAHAIWPEAEFRLLLEKERQRADRGNHEFCLLVIDVDNGLKDKVPLIVKCISRRIRNIDECGWFEPNRIGIILPYTKPEGVTELFNNMNKAMNSILKDDHCVIYAYPMPGPRK